MSDHKKTKDQLLAEIQDLRDQVETLQGDKEELQACSGAVVDGIITIDVDRRIHSINPAAEQIFGYNAAEVIGQNVKMLMPEPYHGEHDGYVDRYLETGEKRIIGIGREVVGRRKDGTTFPMYLGVSEFQARGRHMFTGLIRDLTEVKEIEEKATRVGRILDDSLNEIYLFDAETLKFIEVNQGAQRNLGYDMAELGAMTPLDLKPEFTLEQFENLLQPLRSGRQKKVEFKTNHQRKDGSLYPVEVHVQLSQVGGSAVFVAIILDTTDQQHLEHQLLQAQKMESVGRLAGGVAHDFNNQLGIMLFDIEMLLESQPKEAAIQEDLQSIRRVVLRSADLTRQLLLFSRRQPMDKAPLNLNAQIGQLEKMLGRFLGENIVLKTELCEGVWSIQADASTLDQVMTNLALNARDAMPDGGTLSIKTSKRVVESDYANHYPNGRPGHFVCLSVQDTGTGIAEDIVDQIFEPFFSTKDESRGTGLGLAVVYGVVEAHEGWISVDSQVGQGTQFDIFLPALNVGAGEFDGDEFGREGEFSNRGREERILLVEDEPDLRQRMERVLTLNGYRVAACASVDETIAMFEREQGAFDAVVSDIVLPDGRGPDLIDKLLEQQPGLAVMFTSGYTDDQAGVQAIERLKFPHLQKPVGVQELLNQVRQILDA